MLKYYTTDGNYGIDDSNERINGENFLLKEDEVTTEELLMELIDEVRKVVE